MALNLPYALKELGEQLELPDLRFDQDGFCSISTDQLQVCFVDFSSNDAILMFSQVSDLPDEPDVEFLTMLMEGNFFTRETGGATLGVDEFKNAVVISKTLSLSALDKDSFIEQVADFADIAAYWIEKIAGYFEESPALDSIDGSPVVGKNSQIRG